MHITGSPTVYCRIFSKFYLPFSGKIRSEVLRANCLIKLIPLAERPANFVAAFLGRIPLSPPPCFLFHRYRDRNIGAPFFPFLIFEFPPSALCFAVLLSLAAVLSCFLPSSPRFPLLSSRA